MVVDFWKAGGGEKGGGRKEHIGGATTPSPYGYVLEANTKYYSIICVHSTIN